MMLTGNYLRSLILSAFLAILKIINAQPGTGMPFWVLSPGSDSGVVNINWLSNPPEVYQFENSITARRASTTTAITICGEPVFHVIHSGILNTPNNLFIYDPRGLPLLDNTTPNGPGFNAKAFSGEIFALQVPGSIDEWYIIYQQWKSSNGAPLNDGDYVPGYELYSKVRYRCGEIEVLERDVPLTASGTAHLYRNSASVSFLPDNPAQLCLYKVRIHSSGSEISLDRFLITSAGIQFDKNTGAVPADCWSLTVSSASLEVSSDGRWIAVNNRDQSTNGNTFILFDALPFNNQPGNHRNIDMDDLILQPDNQIVHTAATVSEVYSTNSQLFFLENMESKIVDIEFSPDSRYLYFICGGFVAGGYTNATYLGQIETGTVFDPEPYPYKLRLQIQIPPGPFDWNSGAGGVEANYANVYYMLWCISKTYDDEMYFIKRNTPWLFSIPEPNEPMPQNLVPSQIDLSDADHPNIQVWGKQWLMPDQIDGYDYITATGPSIFLGNDTLVCTGTEIMLDPGDMFESYCWQDGSSEQVYNVSQSGIYWVEVIDGNGCFARDTIEVGMLVEEISLGNDTVICEGDSIIITPGPGHVAYSWQDGSNGPDYLVRTAGTYWVEVLTEIGCLVKDTLEVNTHSEAVHLGDDRTICENDSVYLSAGSGFTDYLWQNGATRQGIFASESGLYWVEATASGGCKARDSVYVNVNPLPSVYLGQDTSLAPGESLVLDAGAGFDDYMWQDGSFDRYFEVTREGEYWVTVMNNYCSAADTINIIYDDCIANIFAPNCFTPNGDGFNERFNVTVTNIDQFTLYIFNRWGQLLFETTNINEGWDGKVNGNLCAVGTYFYLVKYTTQCSLGNARSGEEKGSVTLLE